MMTDPSFNFGGAAIDPLPAEPGCWIITKKENYMSLNRKIKKKKKQTKKTMIGIKIQM